MSRGFSVQMVAGAIKYLADEFKVGGPDLKFFGKQPLLELQAALDQRNSGSAGMGSVGAAQLTNKISNMAIEAIEDARARMKRRAKAQQLADPG